MPKVSVIVPCYNHAKYLKERIDSILNQSFRDFELILLDDCSKDNSAEILLSYKDNEKVSNVIINEKNSGTTFKQWQKGISLAKGDYVWIAESDDYADWSFLDRLVKILDENPKVGLAYSQSYKVDENSNIFGDMVDYTSCFSPNKWESDYINNGKDEIVNFLTKMNTIPNASAILFRKSAISKFPEEIKGMKLVGDWFFYCNILVEHDIAFVSDKLNYYRFQNMSVRSKSVPEKNYVDKAIGWSNLNKRFKLPKSAKLYIINEAVGIHVYIQLITRELSYRIKLWFKILFKATMFFPYVNKMLLKNIFAKKK